MKALWHCAYWPAVAVVVLCSILNFLTMAICGVAISAAEHAEKKLRR